MPHICGLRPARPCFVLVALAFLGLLVCWPAALASAGDTASSLLRKLPTTIFENTAQSLTEEEKAFLLDKGYAGEWVLVKAQDDFLVMSLPSSQDGEVLVRMFQNGDRGVVVLGATTEGACAAELWSTDSKGRLAPAMEPEEPAPSEFFRNKAPLSPGVHMTTNMCFDGEALERKPLFWGPKGQVHLNTDFRILYYWDGIGFQHKEIIPAQSELSGTLQPLTPGRGEPGKDAFGAEPITGQSNEN